MIDGLHLDETFLSEDHQALRSAVRRFVHEQMLPEVDTWEAQRRLPRSLFKTMGEVGLLGLSVPVELGGQGAGVRGALILHEELGRSTYGGLGSSIGAHADFSAAHLVRSGTPEQQERFLPGYLDGSIICGLGVTEPGASSDIARMSVRAVRDGDDYVLNGTKTLITNADIGDLFFVVARTGGPDSGRRGLSLFAVPRDLEGFANGTTFEKLGWHCSNTGELVFSGCRVPATNLIGEEGGGFLSVLGGLDHERLCLSAQAIGLARAALDETLTAVRDRPAYGRTLWDLQAVRHRIAELTAELAAATTLVYHLAALADQGRDIRAGVAAVKASVPELANRIAYAGTQLAGGAAFLDDSTLARIARDTRFLAVAGGSTVVMRDEVARAVGR